MRSEGYSTWSVCLCVCLLLNISLFTRLFVPQTILTFSAADEGRNFKRFSLKMLRCEAIERFLLIRLHDKSPFFTSQKTRMRMNLDHVASSHLVLGETFFASSIIAKWPLAVCLRQRYARSVKLLHL